MKRLLPILLAATVLICGPAVAGIVAQTGAAPFLSVDASEDFQGFADFVSPGQPFSSGGFTFDDVGSFVIWGSGGAVGFPTRSLYENGGSAGLLSIVLAGGSDFDQIQFDVGNGNGPANPQYLWVRTYNNGSPTGIDFDFDTAPADTISVWTDGLTVFDEIRIGAYSSSAGRDLHVESTGSATAIDNVIAGARIPEPSTIVLLGLGVAGLTAHRARRRRKACA